MLVPVEDLLAAMRGLPPVDRYPEDYYRSSAGVFGTNGVDARVRVVTFVKHRFTEPNLTGFRECLCWALETRD